MTTSNIPTSKRCSKCGIDKSLSEFSKHKNKRDGLVSQCKDCARKYYQTNRERILEHQQEYREANRERYLEYQRKYHPANRERKREYDREYQQANRERYLEYQRKYQQANPHIYAAARHRRKARKRSLPNDFTTEHMRMCLIYFADTCAYCGNQFTDLFGNVSLHWDHFIPLVADDCPGTVPANMLCTCSDCNRSKNATMPAEWLLQRFGKRKAKQILERIRAYFESIEG